ncbi:MAG: hypothetical protein HKN04_11785 [Rhodothermaceae bacterium]|nr:hypothetical protein [Rhodothermaceae bacterium]
MKNFTRLSALVLLVAILSGCGGEAPADAPATDDPVSVSGDPASTTTDTPAFPETSEALEANLTTYRLDMDKLERWERAVEHLQQLSDAHPELEDTWRNRDADSASFDELIALIEDEPLARQALDDAGTSPREYVLTTLALVHAMTARAAEDLGEFAQGIVVPEEVNPENVTFVREHDTEIQRLFAGMEE